MPFWRRNGHDDRSRDAASQDPNGSLISSSDAASSVEGPPPSEAHIQVPASNEQSASITSEGAGAATPVSIEEPTGGTAAETSITPSPNPERAYVEYHSETTTQFPDGTVEQTRRDLKADVPAADAIPLATALTNPRPALAPDPASDTPSPLLLRPGGLDIPDRGEDPSGQD